MFNQADLKKPKTEQFPTFRGSKRNLLYVKAIAEKQGVSYAAVMNLILTDAIGKFQSTDSFKLSDEEMQELFDKSLA